MRRDSNPSWKENRSSLAHSTPPTKNTRWQPDYKSGFFVIYIFPLWVILSSSCFNMLNIKLPLMLHDLKSHSLYSSDIFPPHNLRLCSSEVDLNRLKSEPLLFQLLGKEQVWTVCLHWNVFSAALSALHTHTSPGSGQEAGPTPPHPPSLSGRAPGFHPREPLGFRRLNSTGLKDVVFSVWG